MAMFLSAGMIQYFTGEYDNDGDPIYQTLTVPTTGVPVALVIDDGVHEIDDGDDSYYYEYTPVKGVGIPNTLNGNNIKFTWSNAQSYIDTYATKQNVGVLSSGWYLPDMKNFQYTSDVIFRLCNSGYHPEDGFSFWLNTELNSKYAYTGQILYYEDDDEYVKGNSYYLKTSSQIVLSYIDFVYEDKSSSHYGE